MKLVVGLGNPGLRYRNTRHNVGFLTVKELSRELSIPLRRREFRGLLGEGSLGGEKIILFMPETYMNLSGEAVAGIAKRKMVELEDLLVVCDDINLMLGFLRLRKKGTSGGHNGLESVIRCLGTGEFARLRIGIGRDQRTGNLVNFVLKPFNREERPLISRTVREAAECVLQWIKEGPEKAMASFNRRQG